VPDGAPRRKLTIVPEILPTPESSGGPDGVRARAVSHMRKLMATTALLGACRPSSTGSGDAGPSPSASTPSSTDAGAVTSGDASDGDASVEDAALGDSVGAFARDASATDIVVAPDASADAALEGGAADAGREGAKKTDPCSPSTYVDARGQVVCKPACKVTRVMHRGRSHPVSDPPAHPPGWKPPWRPPEPNDACIVWVEDPNEPSCDPPYVIDKYGHKKYKTECIRQ
jgi:hypothetical protein